MHTPSRNQVGALGLRLDAEERPLGKLGVDKGTEVVHRGAGEKTPYIHVI